jgi:PRA1 family protein
MTEDAITSWRARLARVAPSIQPQPWATFFHTDSLSKPLKLDNALARAAANARAYSSNYGLLGGACILCATLTSPLCAFAVLLGAAGGGAYAADYRGVSTQVRGRQLRERVLHSTP